MQTPERHRLNWNRVEGSWKQALAGSKTVGHTHGREPDPGQRQARPIGRQNPWALRNRERQKSL